MHSRNSVLSLVLLLLGVVGCGPGYNVVPVSGRITLDGKPLTNATILTQPVGTKENTTPGPGSGALTDDDGKFVLKLQVGDEDGAVPGKHTIKIVKNDKQRASNDDTAVRVVSKIPLDYQEAKETYTIPEEGTDAMNIDMESRKRR